MTGSGTVPGRSGISGRGKRGGGGGVALFPTPPPPQLRLADSPAPVRSWGCWLASGREMAEGCVVGPYAHLRPHSRLRSKAKVGNFCEVKKAVIGAGSKGPHLAYVGDATIGESVNVGAGTITC